LNFEIVTLSEKKLIGKHLTMSLSQNKTGQLWGSFMPRRKEIHNTVGKDLYSMQIYGAAHFQNFSPDTQFEKWAAVEVSSFDSIPPEMESYTLSGGLYAVFIHKGSSTDTRTFQYIFGTWLPASEFALDNRPHFELLGEKYRNNDPDSEEEIWIPVRKK
jgi:AraC family transcriptional regulator